MTSFNRASVWTECAVSFESVPTDPVAVECTCGTCFCFTCQQEPHDPVHSCEVAKTWLDKVAAEGENVSWVLANTKPCPNCSELISKINGCDQMWCTSCHTAFSWNTGLEDKGAVIHNPHYYQYQREVNNGVIPRNPGDNPCEMDRRMYANFYHLVQTTIVNYLFRTQTDVTNYNIEMPELKQQISENIDQVFAFSIKTEEIKNIIRVFNHYNWELNHLNTQIQHDTDHKNLRIDYILKKSDSTTENRWQLKLNGHDRFSSRNYRYFTRTQVWQHHSGAGGLDSENVSSGAFNDSIAVYSFALKPEEHQPSGTCNFSRIDNAQLSFPAQGSDSHSATAPYGKDTGLIIYAVNYNVLRIMSGMGGLAYSN